MANPSICLVPEVGIEPTLPQGKGDFECKKSGNGKASDFKYVFDFSGIFLFAQLGNVRQNLEKLDMTGTK